MQVDVVIPSYRGYTRLAAMLVSLEEHDPFAREMCRITVFEDPSTPDVAKAYDRLQTLFPYIKVVHLPKWSNMHGAAQAAFDAVPGPWIVYLGDDVLFTPGSLSNMLAFLLRNKLETVGLVQFPYWNAHDLSEDNTNPEYHGPKLLRTKEEMYALGTDWLRQVPRNKHWDGEGFAQPYVNVNGCGFACRKDHFDAIGGFCRETWCLDESISVRTWQRSNLSIVCLPGPPLVHYFGAAADHPPHDLHTEEAWIKGMGMTKAEGSTLSYAAMQARAAAVNEEMRRARY